MKSVIYLKSLPVDEVSVLKKTLNNKYKEMELILPQTEEELQKAVLLSNIKFIFINECNSLEYLKEIQTNIICLSSGKISTKDYPLLNIIFFESIVELCNFLIIEDLSSEIIDVAVPTIEVENATIEHSIVPLDQEEDLGYIFTEETENIDLISIHIDQNANDSIPINMNENQNNIEIFLNEESAPPISAETNLSTADEQPNNRTDSKNAKQNSYSEKVRDEIKEDHKSQQSIPSEHKKLLDRAVEIRKKSFSRTFFDKNKTVGVWSPLHRTGVTTFIMNYAAFLGQQKVSSAVIEGIGDNRILKTMLHRITPIPDNWNSYANALHNTNASVEQINWTYGGVQWIPLDDNDFYIKWDSELLFHYINNVKYFDIVLCDLPSGEMKEYTKRTIEQLDELWILMDDSFHQFLSWKEYIHDIIKDFPFKTYLIFNKKYEFSQDVRLSKEMDIPLLVSLPSLHKETMRQYYENTLLINQSTVYEQLLEPYLKLSNHLLGIEFDIPDLPKKWGFSNLLKFFNSIKTPN